MTKRPVSDNQKEVMQPWMVLRLGDLGIAALTSSETITHIGWFLTTNNGDLGDSCFLTAWRGRSGLASNSTTSGFLRRLNKRLTFRISTDIINGIEQVSFNRWVYLSYFRRSILNGRIKQTLGGQFFFVFFFFAFRKTKSSSTHERFGNLTNGFLEGFLFLRSDVDLGWQKDAWTARKTCTTWRSRR